MRTPSTAGSPTVVFFSRARSRSATASRCWRGTMARRIAVHFWPALTVISRATSLTKSSNSSSSGVTSGARIAQLSESASALNGTDWRIRFGCTRSLAAVSAEPVKVTTSWPSRRSSRSPVPPITSCSAPVGQQAGLDHQPHRRLGQVARRAGRLADAGHAGEKARRELLEQAPDREVEGIDVHRQAAARHQDVGAGEGAGLAQRHRRAFVHHVARRQLGAAHAGVGEQRAGAAFDVDPAVGARGAGVRRDRVELLLALGQVLGQRLQDARRAAGSRSSSAPARRCGARSCTASAKSILSLCSAATARPLIALFSDWAGESRRASGRRCSSGGRGSWGQSADSGCTAARPPMKRSATMGAIAAWFSSPPGLQPGEHPVDHAEQQHGQRRGERGALQIGADCADDLGEAGHDLALAAEDACLVGLAQEAHVLGQHAVRVLGVGVLLEDACDQLAQLVAPRPAACADTSLTMACRRSTCSSQMLASSASLSRK